MAVFLISPEVKAQARRITEYAATQHHWYRVKNGLNIDGWTPGDRPEHILTSGTIRAVFSYTLATTTQTLYRHLSVTNVNGYPQPMVVYTLAHMFGFTGVEPDETDVVMKPAKDWKVQIDGKIVILYQKIPNPTLN